MSLDKWKNSLNPNDFFPSGILDNFEEKNKMKITEQELNTLNKQEKQKNAIAHDLGALELRKHKLLHLLDDVLEHQEMTFEEIEEDYGKINIDLKTGEYTEIKKDEKSK